jgi:hypothetical protein
MAGSNISYPRGVAPGKAAARPRIPPLLAREGVVPSGATMPILVMRDHYASPPRRGLFGGAAGNRRTAAAARPKPAEPPESWAQSIGPGVHDFGLGGVRGVMDVGGTIGWGADSLGSATGLWDTHAQDAVDRAKDRVAAHEYHPGGWADMGGRIVGNVLATAPLAEVKALQALPMVRDAMMARKAAIVAGSAAPKAAQLVARTARVGDTIAQGAAGGLAASGGHDVERNMAVGTVAAPVLRVVTERVAAPVARAGYAAGRRLAAEVANSRLARAVRTVLGDAGYQARPSVNALYSRATQFLRPQEVPQRPFEADYPNGAKADGAGNLKLDMEGRPLTAELIVGRRKIGGPDVPVDDDATMAFANKLTPGGLVPRWKIRDGGWARTHVDRSGKPIRVELSGAVPQDEVPLVVGHENGHILDQLAGGIPTEGLLREAEDIYATHVTPREEFEKATPENWGYSVEEVPREHMAEMVRAYMTDPNAMKAQWPEAAARIREYVNGNPKLNRVIQFNSLGAGLVGGGLARKALVAAQDRRRR